MKVALVCCLLLLFLPVSIGSPNTDSLMAKLNRTIKNAQIYDNQKLNEVNKLKSLLQQSSANEISRNYEIVLNVYEEYKSYNYDSALTYAKKLQQLASGISSPSLLIDARLKIIFIMLSAGLFKETYDSLTLINIKDSPDTLKAEFYTLSGRYYYDIASYDLDPGYSVAYDKKGSSYMDSALAYYKLGSFEYTYYKGLRFYKQFKNDSASVYFQKLMNTTGLTNHQLALTASTLSSIYLQNKDTSTAIRLLTQAAIADIKSSIKETFAIFNLAELLYIKNDVTNASLLIENAIANANAYG
ncbi:MAG: tetratricopeptide repeat protein, partial [Bacteroidota bacterium]|nr:tetratricopeptide repeat protein [Bacteroidota bacterium]